MSQLKRYLKKNLYLSNKKKKKKKRVKLWDRDPRHDIFQGNYTQCCIAVGVKDTPTRGLTTHDPSTVMQYLSDTGINVEIYR